MHDTDGRHVVKGPQKYTKKHKVHTDSKGGGGSIHHHSGDRDFNTLLSLVES